MSKTILIPVDGSANSATAVDYGIYIAPKLEATLTGLHVIDVYLIQGPLMTDISATVGIPPYDGFFEAVETSLKEKADAVLKNFEDRCRTAGISCLTKKNIGKISDTIIEEAENADLVLMAKKGEHFHLKEGGLLGSVAEAVIRRSGKPVIVIPESFREIESIGLAYDGSAPARKALELCLNISEKSKWPITVLIISADAQKAANLSAQVEEMAQKNLADCEVIISAGREADEILKFIAEGAVELMVMGAYGHNRLRQWLLGSTTSHIIHKSPIPVLLIR
ncbi:MAG: universal stress protein family protein [Syntrophaceae bacterium]|nr:MAG: universal stress protein family protein [Syntrophaceae bacterium]